MNTADYIIAKAIVLFHENLDCKMASEAFGVDFHNMCAYVKGRKRMPLKLAFQIFDYLNAKVVIFRGV